MAYNDAGVLILNVKCAKILFMKTMKKIILGKLLLFLSAIYYTWVNILFDYHIYYNIHIYCYLESVSNPPKSSKILKISSHTMWLYLPFKISLIICDYISQPNNQTHAIRAGFIELPLCLFQQQPPPTSQVNDNFHTIADRPNRIHTT